MGGGQSITRRGIGQAHYQPHADPISARLLHTAAFIERNRYVS
jgi:hypothetical protein